MKLLLYTHEFPPFLGGLATISHKLTKGFSDSKIEIIALVPSYGGNEKGFDKKLDCKVCRIPLIGNKIIRAIPFLQQLIGMFYLGYSVKKLKPDLVLFITEEAEVTGGLLSYFIKFNSVVRVAGSGIMTCFHGNNFFKKLQKYPMKRLYNKCKKVIAISNYTKSLLIDIDVPEKKIEVIYNGISDHLLNNETNFEKVSQLKKELGILENEKLFITIARILPRKGQDFVIRALPKVVKQFPNVKYIVVGEGRYKEKFEELSKELGLENIVSFTGGVSHNDIIHYLDMCDIFIMPNRLWNNKVEGFGNSFIEASSRGLPVIAGNDSGAVEAVSNGQTGLVVDSENIDSIAEGMIKLLRDSSVAKSLGDNGVKFVKENFTDDLMISNYVSLLKETVNQ